MHDGHDEPDTAVTRIDSPTADRFTAALDAAKTDARWWHGGSLHGYRAAAAMTSRAPTPDRKPLKGLPWTSSYTTGELAQLFRTVLAADAHDADRDPAEHEAALIAALKPARRACRRVKLPRQPDDELLGIHYALLDSHAAPPLDAPDAWADWADWAAAQREAIDALKLHHGWAAGGLPRAWLTVVPSAPNDRAAPDADRLAQESHAAYQQLRTHGIVMGGDTRAAAWVWSRLGWPAEEPAAWVRDARDTAKAAKLSIGAAVLPLSPLSLTGAPPDHAADAWVAWRDRLKADKVQRYLGREPLAALLAAHDLQHANQPAGSLDATTHATDPVAFNRLWRLTLLRTAYAASMEAMG